jgi:hypothetical protein
MTQTKFLITGATGATGGDAARQRISTISNSPTTTQFRTISRPDPGDRIADVEVEGLHWLPQSILGLATPAALRIDPAHFSPSGQFVGFSMLPVIISTMLEDHYPAASASRANLDLSEDEIADIVRRWIPTARSVALGELN